MSSVDYNILEIIDRNDQKYMALLDAYNAKFMGYIVIIFTFFVILVCSFCLKSLCFSVIEKLKSYDNNNTQSMQNMMPYDNNRANELYYLQNNTKQNINKEHYMTQNNNNKQNTMYINEGLYRMQNNQLSYQ